MRIIITENQLKKLTSVLCEQIGQDFNAKYPNLSKMFQFLSLGQQSNTSSGVESGVEGMAVPTGNGKLIHPLGAGYRISSKFGVNRGTRSHKGLDIAAPTGTPVLAPADGVIIQAGDIGGNCGGFIKIDHGNLITKYCHLYSWVVRPGDKVNQGQRIGSVGGGKNDPHRGRSTGSHLHYEILNKNNLVAQNPQQSQYGIA